MFIMIIDILLQIELILAFVGETAQRHKYVAVFSWSVNNYLRWQRKTFAISLN